LVNKTMDIAKTFNPQTILLWRKVADHPEAQRILGLFPKAVVHIVKQQRVTTASNRSTGQALVAGKRTLMIGQTSCFAGHFDGQLGQNVCCRPYYKLVPLSNGCPYYCTYCYLAFIYRKYAPFIKININYDTMFKQIRKAIADTDRVVSFNMGEMLDSLALDHVTKLSTMLIPFFADFSRGFLMLLTKSSNVNNLLTIKPNPQTIISWSLNSQQIIQKYELGTASLTERIKAAKLCQEHGYHIRLRIDPGIIYSDPSTSLGTSWETGYSDLIEKTLTAIRPENITLGMLRLLPGHSHLANQAYGNRARELQNCNLVKGASDGKLRYPPKQRIEFYSFLIDTIRCFDKKVSISLCRETSEIWDIFKNRCERGKCNCIIW
jgi:spore photoproduct lyase